MRELDLMKSECDRIEKSIKSITRFSQVAPTFKWIKIFEERFKCPHVANTLRTDLSLVEL